MVCHPVSSCSGVSMSHAWRMNRHRLFGNRSKMPPVENSHVIHDFAGRNPRRNQSLISVLFLVATPLRDPSPHAGQAGGPSRVKQVVRENI
jgi:hypothetical protein